MMILKLILAGVIGYLLGSANTSIIVGRFYGIDVRQHGSGNAGATNTLRTLGKLPALLVAVGDIMKGVIAYLIGKYLCGDIGNAGYLGALVGGLAAILGHNWPVYFKFKGGKGIFTTLAVMLMMDWRIALGMLAIFFAVVALTRYVSLGSILGMAMFPVFIGIFNNKGTYFLATAVIVSLLAIFKHRSNIVRLLKGTESKLGAKKNA